MPRTNAQTATLSHLIDSASEDEFAKSDAEMMLTPDSAIENKAPSKRKAGQAKTGSSATASKVTKAKVPSRRTSGTSLPGGKRAGADKGKARKRTALAERTNLGDASDTEEVDDFEEDMNMKRTRDVAEEADVPAKQVKRGRQPKAKGDNAVAQPVKARKKGKAATVEEQTDALDIVPQSKSAPKASANAEKPNVKKRAPSVEPAKVIPETQPEPMEILETSELPEEVEEPAAPTPRPIARAANRARSISKQRQPLISHRRAGSASDTERGGSDPALRRKLGDVTKKFENLELKYQNLREVGMRDAETNFDKLRRSTEQRAKGQDDLIASLKRELATQRTLATESKTLRAELNNIKSENNRLMTENKSLSTSLQEAQNEVKTLTAKLATLRSSTASTQNTESTGQKVPGSAVKSRTAAAGNTDVVREAQVMKLKEDLYSDLTGLMLRGVKRLEAEDVYDCIQTGRNGTLHFHLAISTREPSGGASYEDVEFAYTPLLDEKNDKDLLDILPDYLTEEICFPRSSAAKFYAKVVDCMTKKVVIEE